MRWPARRGWVRSTDCLSSATVIVALSGAHSRGRLGQFRAGSAGVHCGVGRGFTDRRGADGVAHRRSAIRMLRAGAVAGGHGLLGPRNSGYAD
jgi:hypothetical protein